MGSTNDVLPNGKLVELAGMKISEEEETTSSLTGYHAVDIGISDVGAVCLTWDNLIVTVCAAEKSGSSRSILEGSTGYAHPGRILAIMGPSGCGKSTLLDALAGRLASNAQQSGRILVNGRNQELAFGTSVRYKFKLNHIDLIFLYSNVTVLSLLRPT